MTASKPKFRFFLKFLSFFPLKIHFGSLILDLGCFPFGSKSYHLSPVNCILFNVIQVSQIFIYFSLPSIKIFPFLRVLQLCTSMHFVEYQLFPSLISISPLITIHYKPLLRLRIQSSSFLSKTFNLIMTSSLGFGSIVV
jgi:hypothetical protein